MTERLNYEGHLSELKRGKRVLEIQIAGLVNAMRETLDVMAKPEKLKAEIIRSQAVDLYNKQISYKVILDDMEKIFEMYPHLRED